MRHRVSGYKLGRNTPHRQSMWRNMAISLFTHHQITTTVPKAKSLQPYVEKLITKAKRGDLAARRQVIAIIGNPIAVKHDDDQDVQRNKYGELIGGPRVVKRLFEEIAPKYADRAGGYTRIVRLGKHRIGDGADLCVLQLVGDEDGPQVSGQYSRRREKANKRMEFAAQRRKGKADEPAAATAVAEAEQAPVEQTEQAEQSQQDQPETKSE